MQRNSIRQQLFSTLNSDAVYQLPFNQTQNYQAVKNTPKRNSYLKQSRKSLEKPKYLSVTSKPKNQLKKRLNPSSQKKLQKKNNSVTLGGNKKCITQSANTQNDERSSLCKSCICQYRANTNQHSEYRPTQNNIVPQFENIRQQQNARFFTTPHPLYLQQNPTFQPINRVIYHKLNLASVKPHQPLLANVNFNTQDPSVAGSFGSKIKKRQLSVGKLYSSVPYENQPILSFKKQLVTLEDKNVFLTPRFDKDRQNEQMNPRRKAGFIRSASVKQHKISNFDSVPASSSFLDKQKTLFNQFDDKNQKSQASTVKRVNSIDKYEIDECISKMSSIKKQISQLQYYLNQRLNNAQNRSKSLCKLPYQESSDIAKTSLASRKLNQNTIKLQQTKSIQLANSQTDTLIGKLKNIGSNQLKVSTIYSSVSSEFNKRKPIQNTRQIQDNFKQIYKLKCPLNESPNQWIIKQTREKPVEKNQSIQHKQNRIQILPNFNLNQFINLKNQSSSLISNEFLCYKTQQNQNLNFMR